ncbi:hypothetical protein N2152v2_006313 [Parachlorella kessleri]
MKFASALLLAGLATLLASANAQANKCRLSEKDFVGADFSPLKTACPNSGAGQACDKCMCAVASSFWPVLKSAGYSPAELQSMSRDQAINAISACLPLVLPKLSAAQVSLGSLMSLQNCKAMPSSCPGLQ